MIEPHNRAAPPGGVNVAGLGGVDWRPAYRQEFPKATAWILDMERDLSASIGPTRQPTLLLWGDADPISPVAVGGASAGYGYCGSVIFTT